MLWSCVSSIGYKSGSDCPLDSCRSGGLAVVKINTGSTGRAWDACDELEVVVVVVVVMEVVLVVVAVEVEEVMLLVTGS